MSKTSSKQRYEQLKEWLSVRNNSNKSSKRATPPSRLEFYADKKVK